MQFRPILTSLTFCSVLAAGLPHASAQQAPPPTPKPGPEHAIFKLDLGTWDAVVEATQGPGAPPAKSKGVEVNTIGCGGLCLITDFKGEMMPGVPFHGHGIVAWDAVQKKYKNSWTDSLSRGMMIGDSSWDAASKKATGTMEGPDMTGKVVKMRSVLEYPSGTSRVMTAYAPGPDGKEMQVLKVTYTKRK
jgi:hypothetical protein